MALTATAVLVSAACATNPAIRGVERPGTRRPEAGEARSRVPSCRGGDVGSVWAPRGFCVTEFADDLERPRHLAVAPEGDVVVATRAGVVVLWDGDGDGDADDDDERATLAPGDLGNHGLAFSPDGRFLYYATELAVQRIPWQPRMHRSPGAPEVVVRDLPLTISHPYKTVTFDREGRLYVAVGSLDNLAPGPGAVIMRYALPAALPAGGVPYGSGERFATGIRNAEALAWDGDGRLWAFVNGRDYLRPPGTPESFYLDHPGDWIFRLAAEPGRFYGFPNCWAVGAVPWGERRPGTHLADPEAADGRTDAWCQDPAQVQQPAGVLPAHTGPLGAVLYTGSLFPPEYRNNLFVTAHGSWNRHGQQIGRTIVRVVPEGDRVTRVEKFVGERSGDGNLVEGTWTRRPVGIAQGPDGALYVTDDQDGTVLRVGYGHE